MMWPTLKLNILSLFLLFLFSFDQKAFAVSGGQCENLFLSKSVNQVKMDKVIEDRAELSKNIEKEVDSISDVQLAELKEAAKQESQARARERLLPLAKKLRAYLIRIKFYQDFIGESNSYIQFERIYEIEKLKLYLSSNLKDQAIGILKDRFERFEIAYFQLADNSYRLSKNEPTNLSSRELVKLKNDYAKEFEFYIVMRKLLKNMIKSQKELENASNEEQVLSQNAELVLSELGVRKFLDSKDLKAVGGIPSDRVIERLAYLDHEIREAGVAHMAFQQFKHGILIAIRTLFAKQSFQNAFLDRKSPFWKVFWSTVLLSNYDQVSLSRNLPYIFPLNESIKGNLKDENYIYQQFVMMATESKSSDNFLLTYARLSVYLDVWIKIKDISSKKAEEAKTQFPSSYESDPRTVFYKRLLAAEEVARGKKNYLSPFYKPSVLDFLMRGIMISLYSTGAIMATTDYTFEDLTEDMAKAFAIQFKNKEEKKDKVKDNKPDKPKESKNEDRFFVKLARDSYAVWDAAKVLFTDFEKFNDFINSLEAPAEGSSGEGN